LAYRPEALVAVPCLFDGHGEGGMLQTEEKPIWAKWEYREDGRLDLVATYSEGGAYVSRELSFASLEDAVETLGPGFAEVVSRVREAGGNAGRWRP
jgi:hypothetical protein